MNKIDLNKFDFTIYVGDAIVCAKKMRGHDYKVLVIPKKGSMITFDIDRESQKSILDAITYCLDN